MRGIKISLGLLITVIFVSIIGVNATTKKTYTAVDLKSYNGVVKRGPASKVASGIQKYTNEYNINQCTSNYNDVAVRVYSEAKGCSSWIAVSKDATSAWANNEKTNRVDAYNLEIKNNVWSVCQSQHWGV